ILTSSDTAANPTSVMGASKLLAEKLVSAATNYRGTHETTFASVRFGNVLGSRGSALELFSRQIANGGPVTVTDPDMTRFIMSVDRAVELAIKAADVARGGEVFVFKMPVARLDDLISAVIDVVAPAHDLRPSEIQREPIEPRAGEKAYEELMTDDEASRAVDLGEMFAVLPSIELAPGVRAAYADLPSAPAGAYRSDRVPPLELDAVRRLVEESFESERRAGILA
ncbi:MAG TPA: polysaccharide biosynthesis protein, partial [Candidatus Limnocylindrales bacterium]|nr:polysaccharide biosynthesis protein [Candidatus Limnocylindrales bacterium]